MTIFQTTHNNRNIFFGNRVNANTVPFVDRGILLPNIPAEGMEAEVALSDWADDMFSAQKALLDTAQRLQGQKDTLRIKVYLHALTLALIMY